MLQSRKQTLKNNIYTGQAGIESIQEKPTGYLDIILQNKKISLHAKPGQFIMLKSWLGNDPLLPRPFDIVDTDRKNGTFRLVIKIVGQGTLLMQKLKRGDSVIITGPLGKEITDYNFNSMIMLIRGCGAAAVHYFAKQAFQKGIVIHTILSAAIKEKLILHKELKSFSSTFKTATDDGSSGYKGLGTLLLKDFLKENRVDRVYSCGGGPFYYPYLEELNNKYQLPVYVFVENYMACGSGHCHGCAIKKKTGPDYFLVCQDGPLFSLTEVEKICLIYQ
jgi:dihydroorotate dehydrogenase electron transfer subunit